MTMERSGHKAATGLTVWALIVAVGALSPTSGAPEIQMDTLETVVTVPIGTVSTNTISVANTGDEALNWTLIEEVEGKVVKDFANPWSRATSMRYDATRNCLWLGYWYNNELKKLSTSDGSILGTKSMSSNCERAYAIEMDGSSMWASDVMNERFVKFDLESMSVKATVDYPSGWTFGNGLAIDEDRWYATRNGHRDVVRLNPSTGAVQGTYDDVSRFVADDRSWTVQLSGHSMNRYDCRTAPVSEFSFRMTFRGVLFLLCHSEPTAYSMLFFVRYSGSCAARVAWTAPESGCNRWMESEEPTA